MSVRPTKPERRAVGRRFFNVGEEGEKIKETYGMGVMGREKDVGGLLETENGEESEVEEFSGEEVHCCGGKGLFFCFSLMAKRPRGLGREK